MNVWAEMGRQPKILRWSDWRICSKTESDSKEVREEYFKRELLEKCQMLLKDQARCLKGEYKDLEEFSS